MIRLITTSIIAFFSIINFLSAQDILIKHNGDTIAISVIEINYKYLIYHKLDVDTLMVFTTQRDKLDRINYENGDTYIFN
jgi:hypothetical protein